MKPNPGTEPSIAPVQSAPVRTKVIERQGVKAVPYTRRYPQVRAGICEFCGVLDSNVPSEHQYKLCPHYRGMDLRCSYCDEAIDPDEVIGKSVMNIADHPTNPDTVVVWCDRYECVKRHRERFTLNK